MSSPFAARPYPWSSLDTTSRAEIDASSTMRRWVRTHIDAKRLHETLAGMLGAPVEIVVRRAEPWTEAAGLVGGVAFVVAPADGESPRGHVLVEAEGPLASNVVRRVLRRPPELAATLAGEAPAGLIGAFAAVVSTAARRVGLGAMPVKVTAAGPAVPLESAFAQGAGGCVAVTMTVLVGHDAFDARVVATSAPFARTAATWDEAALRSLASTPLALPIVGAAFRATVGEVGRMGEGDVLVPGTWPLTTEAGRLVGPVVLAAPAAERGMSARIAPDGGLVLGGSFTPLGDDGGREADMGDGADKGELIDALGDVPVLVRVELGEARMAARDWANVGKGDVIALGRRVGESVVLRVGGVPVARGDLVDIDGEVGVRIVERLGGDGGAA